MLKMLEQSSSNCNFFDYNYGPGYAFAAAYEAAAVSSGLNFTAALSARMDYFLNTPNQYGFNVTHNISMPYTGAVGEPTFFAVAYLARAGSEDDLLAATLTAERYMVEYPYRLPDGTFVRPGGWGNQPGNSFLWGDDQFMALALLCRLARVRICRPPTWALRPHTATVVVLALEAHTGL